MIITHVCARVIVQIYCRRSQFARGTGGCSRCWDWRRHAAAVCVGGSEHESVGGGGRSHRQWWNLEDFAREQLQCAKDEGFVRRNLLGAHVGEVLVVFSAVRCKSGQQSDHHPPHPHPHPPPSPVLAFQSRQEKPCRVCSA